MVRWLIAVLFVANMLAFVAVRGMFMPLPAAGSLEPGHLTRQVRPETLRITPISSEADLTVIGAPITPPNVGTSPLGASPAAAVASSAAKGAAASALASSAASTPASVAAPASAPAPAPAPAPASASSPAAAQAPATPSASVPAASH